MRDRSIGLDVTHMPSEGGGDVGSTLRPGDALGDYRILRLIGCGGMGDVYEVENIVSRRRYALKTLTRTAATTRGFVERFRNEARIISDLDHPGIVHVHHVGEAGGVYYLTMDLICGPGGAPRTLEDELAAGRPSEARVRAWSLEICGALDHAHERGVVHRNLKPSNVMLDSQGRIKVADFGLAKVVGAEYLQRSIQRSISLSMAGGMSMGDGRTSAGTPGSDLSVRSTLSTYEYMSPEQKTGTPAGPRSDLYAFGVLLYRMLTGGKPVGRWRPPSAFACNRAWDDLVGRCLEKDPADRPASFAVVAREIEGLLRKRSSAPRIVAVALALAAVVAVGPCAFRACRSVQTGDARVNPPARIPQPASSVRPQARRDVSRPRSVGTAAPAKGQDWVSPSTGMRFVWIPSLRMWVAKYETTNDEYRKLDPDHDSRDYQGMSLNGGRQPVVYVTFDDAKAFADWMTQRDRKTGTLPGDLHYRLPSEWEWQAFAQCGDGRAYPWGGELPPKYGNYSDRRLVDGARQEDNDDGHVVSCPVEESGENDWGLCGVGGNVWEATAGDFFGVTLGAWRGASWNINFRDYWRCDFRYIVTVSNYSGWCGFRLVLSTLVWQSDGARATDPSAIEVPVGSAESNRDRGMVEGQDWVSPATGMEFVWLPALGFWVGRYETTNGEYRKRNPDHSSRDWSGDSLDGERQPVVYVNFDDAKEFADWMTRRDRAAGAVPEHIRYRLPSEREWLAFAQCGDGRAYPWGNAMPPEYGNYSIALLVHEAGSYNDGCPVTCPVERSGRNEWDLHGVGGNVWEATASEGSDGVFGRWRGASWFVGIPAYMGCAVGSAIVGSARMNDCGFRLVASR